MSIEIINSELNLSLHGFAGQAVNRNYPETGFKLMNKMWSVVKSNKLPNKGINVWVYGAGDTMFIGVELGEIPTDSFGLEQMDIIFTKYIRYKHVGAYSGLPQAYKQMRNFLSENNLKSRFLWLEIYGDWNADDSKLETDIIMGLE